MADYCERYLAGMDPERLLTEADEEVERLEETHLNSLKQADADAERLTRERDAAWARIVELEVEVEQVRAERQQVRAEAVNLRRSVEMLNEVVAEKQDERDRLRALLREVYDQSDSVCVMCNHPKNPKVGAAHFDGCRLKAALEGRDV